MLCSFKLRALLLSTLLAAPLWGQDKSAEVLLDFGSSANPSGGISPAWNDVLLGTQGLRVDLLDSLGASTGFGLTLDSSASPEGSNTAGVSAPDLGSPLALLGWPASATLDNFYGSSAKPQVAFELDGLNTQSTYDFTLLASRLGVSDQRTTRYTARGFNTLSIELDPANNSGEVAQILGVVPDAGGRICFSMSAAASNNNASQFFYINALALIENPGAAGGPLLAFDSPDLFLSRKQGSGVYSTQISTLTFSGAMPSVQLSATDLSTGQVPSWLSWPAVSQAGVSFSLDLDPDGLALGMHTASLLAQAAGYPDATLQVSLDVRDAASLNLLYYGNSYSQFNGTVPTLVEYLAECAGLASPNTVARLVGGQNLAFHLNDPLQSAAITQALSAGEEWDFVVLQGFSTEATIQLGDPAQFRSNALQIVSNVRAHSARAKACLFQTWARARGHSFYLGATPVFSGPLQMHAEIKDSYALASADINNAFGSDSARRAAVGQAALLSAFRPQFYNPDLTHPAPSLTLMAAMAIFSRIYGLRACDLAPDFDGSSNLVQRLNSFGIDEDEWRRLAGSADRADVPPARRFPGSGEDYLLTSGSDAMLDACPNKTLPAGSNLGVRLLSPNGSANGNLSILYVDLDPFGAPWPGSPLFPEIHYRSATSVQLLQSAALNGDGQLRAWILPRRLAGQSILIQGQVLWPSPNTGNAFSMTDAHEIHLSGFSPVGPVLGPPAALR